MFWKRLGVISLVLLSVFSIAKLNTPVLAVDGIPSGSLTQGKTDLDGAGIDPAIKGADVPDNVVDYVLAIVNWILLFVGICMLVIIIYLGFRLLISGSDDSQMENAKKGLFHMIMGLLLILASYAIVNTLIVYLPSQDSPGGGLGGTTVSGNPSWATGGTPTGTPTWTPTWTPSTDSTIVTPPAGVTSVDKVKDKINSSTLDAILSADPSITDIKETNDGGYQLGSVDADGNFVVSPASSNTYYPVSKVNTSLKYGDGSSVDSNNVTAGKAFSPTFDLKVPIGWEVGEVTGLFQKSDYESTPITISPSDVSWRSITIPNVTYDEPGTYTITLALENEVSSVLEEYEITVSGIEKPSFQWGMTAGKYNEVKFDTANEYTDYTKSWNIKKGGVACGSSVCNFNSGFDSTSNNPIITFKDVGEYVVELEITKSGFSETVETIVNIDSVLSLEGAGTVTQTGSLD